MSRHSRISNRPPSSKRDTNAGRSNFSLMDALSAANSSQVKRVGTNRGVSRRKQRDTEEENKKTGEPSIPRKPASSAQGRTTSSRSSFKGLPASSSFKAAPEVFAPRGSATGLGEKVEIALKELGEIQSNRRPPSQPVFSPRIGAFKDKSTLESDEEETTASAKTQSSGNNVKLSTLQGVMKKLYSRNMALKSDNEKLLARLKEAGISVDLGTTSPDSSTNELNMDSKSEKENFAKSHLLFLLSQREKTIQKLKFTLEQERVRASGSESIQELGSASPEPPIAPTSSRFSTDSQACDHLRRFSTLRADYQVRLNARLNRAGIPAKIPPKVLYLITQLQQSLVQEATHRQAEKMILHAELTRADLAAAQSFVDRRLLQQRMKELQSEIEQREATALKVESQVFTILERMHKLEKENARLRNPNPQQNE